MYLEATITSKGQITIPARLRQQFSLKDGDKIEFYLDHNGRIIMRPRCQSTAVFLDALESRRPAPEISSDDQAIGLAILEKDARSSRLRAKSK